MNRTQPFHSIVALVAFLFWPKHILCQAFSSPEDQQALMIALTVAAKTLPWNRWRFKELRRIVFTSTRNGAKLLTFSPGGNPLLLSAARCWLKSHCCPLAKSDSHKLHCFICDAMMAMLELKALLLHDLDECLGQPWTVVAQANQSHQS